MNFYKMFPIPSDRLQFKDLVTEFLLNLSLCVKSGATEMPVEWLLDVVFPRAGCVTFSKPGDFPEPQVPHLESRNGSSLFHMVIRIQ